ncbi:MAG TPA: AtpZ/AtpI family protein [Thermoanaerobaculia bacterium]|jgi:F0F1-type ATP synthase assembly protein I
MQPDNKKKEYRELLEASSLAWMFPIAIGLGALWGWGMDKFFGTWPWLTGIFTGFGIIAAFVNLFRMSSRSQ